MSVILNFFTLFWQVLTGKAWWALLLISLGDICLTSPHIPALAFLLALGTSLGLCYLTMRGMHKEKWIRLPFGILAGFFCLMTACAVTLSVSAPLAEQHISHSISEWGKAMKENPQCWSPNPAQDFKNRLTKQQISMQSANHRTMLSLSPPSSTDESLASSNTALFERSAQALAGMAADAFKTDFPLLAPYVHFEFERIVNGDFLLHARAYWANPPKTHRGQTNADIITRSYDAELLAPIAHGIISQARQATASLSTSLSIITALLAMLALLASLTIVFFDLDWQIRLR